MDAMATRGWGIGVSGAMIIAALALALTAPEQRPPQGRAPWVAPTASDTVSSAPAPSTVIVHFRGGGPLARAERARSSRRVTAELSHQRAFRGLCFARFESRGVVLRACDGGVLEGWRQRLLAMRAVARVEAGE